MLPPDASHDTRLTVLTLSLRMPPPGHRPPPIPVSSNRRPSLPAQVFLQLATCCVHLFKNRGRSTARDAAAAVVT